MKLERFDRFALAHLPTPLEPLKRLSAHLDGPEIWIKRDDCTGLASGGNKTRKLEYLLPDALAHGADTLVTIGGIQSNHTRQTAAAAARAGLRSVLVQERWVTWPGEDYERVGNILLSRVLGAHRDRAWRRCIDEREPGGGGRTGSRAGRRAIHHPIRRV
jgi:1-aminocyclopropane-1-carboxylate deaminase